MEFPKTPLPLPMTRQIGLVKLSEVVRKLVPPGRQDKIYEISYILPPSVVTSHIFLTKIKTPTVIIAQLASSGSSSMTVWTMSISSLISGRSAGSIRRHFRTTSRIDSLISTVLAAWACCCC